MAPAVSSFGMRHPGFEHCFGYAGVVASGGLPENDADFVFAAVIVEGHPIVGLPASAR